MNWVTETSRMREECAVTFHLGFVDAGGGRVGVQIHTEWIKCFAVLAGDRPKILFIYERIYIKITNSRRLQIVLE